MKPQQKLTSQQQQEQQTHAVEQQQHGLESAPLEFSSVDEMLRHDALHTPVPPSVEQRLQESLNQSPTPPRSPWWKRLLGS